jgi:hypothetical protein
MGDKLDELVNRGLTPGNSILLFSKASRLDLKPTQKSTQKIPEMPSSKVRRPTREADRSVPGSDDIKHEWS